MLVNHSRTRDIKEKKNKKRRKDKRLKGKGERKEMEVKFYGSLSEVCRIRLSLEQALCSGHLNSSSTEKQIFLYALHMYEGPSDSGWENREIFHHGKIDDSLSFFSCQL